MDFIRTDGRNKDFIENCRLLDIDLDRRVGKKIKRDKYKKYNQLDEIKEANISVQGATNDIKKCFRYAEWKSQIFHSIFTYSLVALIDEIKPSVAFLLSSKLIFSQSSR